jgi:predicted DNA-binding ribbon-helix-helix protein
VGSQLTRRSLSLRGQKFSFWIEQHFWVCFEEIARAQATTADQLAHAIATKQMNESLPSAIRAYVLEYFQDQSHRRKSEDPIAPPAIAPDPTDTWSYGIRPRWLN